MLLIAETEQTAIASNISSSSGSGSGSLRTYTECYIMLCACGVRITLCSKFNVTHKDSSSSSSTIQPRLVRPQGNINNPEQIQRCLARCMMDH